MHISRRGTSNVSVMGTKPFKVTRFSNSKMDLAKVWAEAEKEWENFEPWRRSPQFAEDQKQYESTIDERLRTALQALGFPRESDELVYWYTRVHPLMLNGKTPYDYITERKEEGLSLIIRYLSADINSL